jgi:tRNA dimethylallyltransferase
VGPTGTGKTSVGVALSEMIGGEIVGCDALQVYRRLDVATAKPSTGELDRAVHHLVDLVDPEIDFSLADYVALAEKAVGEIHTRGRVPIVVGGTGMYLRGLLRGIVDAPERDAALRDRLRRMAARFGTARLHRWLGTVDPVSAARLPVGDTQRIVRALEVVLAGGTPWGERLEREGTWSSREERYRTLKIGLDMDRATLVERVEKRVERFFREGLVEEVRDLLRDGLRPDANALKAIGYREVLRALQAGTDPYLVVEEVKMNTRRYAKRQRTWFRKEPGVVWLDASTPPESLLGEISERWRLFTSGRT